MSFSFSPFYTLAVSAQRSASIPSKVRCMYGQKCAPLLFPLSLFCFFPHFFGFCSCVGAAETTRKKRRLSFKGRSAVLCQFIWFRKEMKTTFFSFLPFSAYTAFSFLTFPLFTRSFFSCPFSLFLATTPCSLFTPLCGFKSSAVEVDEVTHSDCEKSRCRKKGKEWVAKHTEVRTKKNIC